MLIDADADVNLRAEYDASALNFAQHHADTKVVDLLRKAGAKR